MTNIRLQLIRLIPLVVGLLACGDVRPRPEEEFHDGRVRVFWDGQPRQSTQLRAALDVIELRGAEECARTGSSRWQLYWDVELHWRPGPAFPCDHTNEAVYAGCIYPEKSGILWIASRDRVADSALVDEIGKLVWRACHEDWEVGLGSHYPPAYSTWVKSTRDAVYTATDGLEN